MSSSHKAGSDFGVDRGVVIILLLWIAVTVVLAGVFGVEAHSQAERVARRRERPLFEQSCSLTCSDGDQNAH